MIEFEGKAYEPQPDETVLDCLLRHGVQVSDNVLCVFNATPLEKYESYRIYIGKWRTEPNQPDFNAPHAVTHVRVRDHVLGLDRPREARPTRA